MKMSKPAVCCDSCFEKIANRSTSAARLWLDLCDLEIASQGLFGLKIKDSSVLRILELLGFILTTDSSNVLMVKVNGKKTDAMGTYFCGGKCDEV
jgi:hypothetical protein